MEVRRMVLGVLILIFEINIEIESLHRTLASIGMEILEGKKVYFC